MKSKTNLPLRGKTIVITRAENQQAKSRDAFEAYGATVLELPALLIGPPDDFRPLDDAISELDSFHWIIFSSSNGVEAVEQRLRAIGRSLKLLPKGLRIAVVGRKTAQTLHQLGVSADFTPPAYVADSLIDNFPVSGFGLKMLIPRVQSGGRNVLGEAFAKAGAKVVQVSAYESRCPASIPEKTINALMNDEIDLLAFTSSKTVVNTTRLFSKYLGISWKEKCSKIKLVSIGPQTSISCKKYFNRVDFEANPHDLDGLIQACILATE